MAKKSSNNADTAALEILNARLWNGVEEEDFLCEDNIQNVDIDDFNNPAMTLFIQNLNLFRQLPLEKDSLKPVERRVLINLFKGGAYLTSLKEERATRKSSLIVADTMKLHAHGDATVYASIVGLAQYWKNPIPLIYGSGNFANITSPDAYAHMRYTEALASYYAYLCFFKDLDMNCLEMLDSTTGSDNKESTEPLALPSRFPNILINGGFGMASGNMFCIPPFNIKELREAVREVINNPNGGSVYLMPDFPTGCDMVDPEEGMRKICETGKGSIKLRAKIDIEQLPNHDWILRIKNIPFMVNFTKLIDDIIKKRNAGILPIKDLRDESDQYKVGKGTLRHVETSINYGLIIDKAHDPYSVKETLYSNTLLEKSLSIDFNIVTNDLDVDRPSLRGMIEMWLNARREYKRRLYNKEMVSLHARIQLLEILIFLTDADNVMDTMNIIRKSKKTEMIEALIKKQKMTSYQAAKICDMALSTFNQESHLGFIAEKEAKEKKLKEIEKIFHSQKKIDQIILEEQDELDPWIVDRKSYIIGETGKYIPNTDHFIIITRMGMVKKTPYKEEIGSKGITIGNLRNGDSPIYADKYNNLESITFFDGYGRYSTIPVSEIESTASNNYGTPLSKIAKLNGKLVTTFAEFNAETIKKLEKKCKCNVELLSVSSDGYAKKTPVKEFFTGRNTKNVVYTKLRDNNDLIIDVKLLMNNSNLLFYSEKGQYSYLSGTDIPEQSKNATGLNCIKMDSLDKCAGVCTVSDDCEYLVILTEKGVMKRCEIAYIGTAGNRKLSSYLSSLDENDKIAWVGGVGKHDKTINILTRNDFSSIKINDIPIKGRKAKGDKMIPVPLGSNLISVHVE